MKVIFKAPGLQPEIIEIDNTLEALQQKVGGYIETVTFTADCCVICNEEGRLLGLPHNLDFLGVDFVGPVLVVGIDAEDFCSLPDEGVPLLLSEMGGRHE
jgi:hypothetical protein